VTDKYYTTKDFKTLNKQWKKKLKDSGFEDIEYDGPSSTNSESLKKTIDATKNKWITKDSTEEFFSIAEDFLWNGEFDKRKNSKQKKIFQMYVEGKIIREIAEALKLDECTIYRNISRVKKKIKQGDW
jgi:DNA-binding NarL/FixJ family response regulator